MCYRLLVKRLFYPMGLLSCSIAFLGAQSVPPATPASPTLLPISTPHQTTTLSLEALQKEMKIATLKTHNPSYQGRELTYVGFWFEDILQKVHIDKRPADLEIVIICRDGYTTVLPASQIGHHKWLLAFNETSGAWTPLPNDGLFVSPGPWYLVGTKKETFGDFPWPYQVVAIRAFSGF